jgi:hypothetical protein
MRTPAEAVIAMGAVAVAELQGLAAVAVAVAVSRTQPDTICRHLRATSPNPARCRSWSSLSDVRATF